MYIVRLSGGLGNQLFQYAFGYALQENSGTVVKFTKHNLGPKAHRELILDKIIDDIPFLEVNGKQVIIEPANVIKRTFFRFLGKELIPVIKESKLGYDSRICTSSINAGYFKGNWTSHKYFENCQPSLRSQLLRGLGLTQRVYPEFEKIVSVHIRRTDFLKNKNMNICSIAYFNSAILFLREKVNNCKFMFFSDDIQWVKKNFKDNEFIFVEPHTKDPL